MKNHRITRAATKDGSSAGQPMHRASNERSFCASRNDACQTSFASGSVARRYGGIDQTMQFESKRPTGIAAKNGATKKTIGAKPVCCEWKAVANGTECRGITM